VKRVDVQFATDKYTVAEVRNVLQNSKLNREDYGVDKYWVLLVVVKE